MKALGSISMRGLAAALLLSLAFAAPAAAADDEEPASTGQRFSEAGQLVFDVLVLRPLGAAATAGGFGAFLIVAPMLAPSREIPYGWDTFVLGPYEYTVERPLGEV